MELNSEVIINIACILGAYLLGSIPTSVWIGKWFYQIDIREHGSKNAGTTNTFRILGAKAGIPVFIIDVLKGFAAVKLIMLTAFIQNSETYVIYCIGLGIAAVLGHIFPIYVGFKGGKGVATLLGVVIAISPIPAVIAFALFGIVITITKYSSVASMSGGLSFPFVNWLVLKTENKALLIFSIVVAILLIITHHKNIKRLINGTENKVSFGKKKN